MTPSHIVLPQVDAGRAKGLPKAKVAGDASAYVDETKPRHTVYRYVGNPGQSALDSGFRDGWDDSSARHRYGESATRHHQPWVSLISSINSRPAKCSYQTSDSIVGVQERDAEDRAF